MLEIQLSPKLHSAVKMMKNVELRKIENPSKDIASSLSNAEVESIANAFKGTAADRVQKVTIRSTWG